MPAQILSATTNNIALAAAALRAGDVVAMPTETVYGLAGVVFDEAALTKIFGVKERPTFDPLICHVPPKTAEQTSWLASLGEQGLVDDTQLSSPARERVEKILTAFWPGPVTLVLPKQARVPDLATSGLPTVAVRCPRHPVAQALLAAVGQPLCAPSANRFGRISPTTAAHVQAELGDRITFILDGDACAIGIESTVLLVERDGRVWLLRPGGLAAHEITRVTGVPIELRSFSSVETATPIPSPGLLASHYAPRKPLRVLDQPLAQMSEAALLSLFETLPPGARIGVLLAQSETELCANLSLHLYAVLGPEAELASIALSASGDLAESARRLFAALRELDDDPYVDTIWAEQVTDDGGLGHAVNDRLRRASHP